MQWQGTATNQNTLKFVLSDPGLTPLSIDRYAAPIVPLSVYKNGPLLFPSFGPLTTRSTVSTAGLPKCMGTMKSSANAAVEAGVPLKYPAQMCLLVNIQSVHAVILPETYKGLGS